MQSFLSLSALRNFCAAIGRLMEIDSAVSPWYAGIRGGGREGAGPARGERERQRES